MAINSTRLTTTGDTVLYTSSGVNAVTLIVVCNTGTPNPADETINSCTLQLNLVKSGVLANDANAIVKNLLIPAGETVFFNDERLILDGNGSQMDSIWVGCSSADKLSVTVSTLPV